MSLSTFSIFYFNFEINEDFRYLNFDEGSGELTASIELGAYTPTQLAEQIAIAMNAVGTFAYTVVFNRTSRSFTISSLSGSFDLLVSTGSSDASAYSVIGFVGADRTGTSTYTGAESGNIYEPQFILQDHISSENFQSLISPTVVKTAAGQVEVIRFGVEKFVQMNIKWINNKFDASDSRIFKYNPEGIEDAQEFLQYLVTKKPVEFMADISALNTFQQLLLESTEQDQMGTKYQLKELYDKGLPNFFETGKLVFRVIE